MDGEVSALLVEYPRADEGGLWRWNGMAEAGAHCLLL